MCLAIIGKIKKITGPNALADFDGVEKKINITLIDAKINDHVLIHAGFAIEKITQQEASAIKNDLQK